MTLTPVRQSGVFYPQVLRKLHPAHPAAIVLRQQQLTPFGCYQHATPCVLAQDLFLAPLFELAEMS